MALPFDRGDDFARDKPALHPCPHLHGGFGCGIHAGLTDAGYGGCARYDCKGAGQRVMRELFPDADWWRDPGLRAPLADAFATMRRIHEALVLLNAARALPLPAPLAEDREALIALFHPPADWTPATLAAFDLPGANRGLTAFLRALRAHVPGRTRG